MTISRDPDRIVRAWLDLVPSEAPDRVIESVLQAAETTPQVRPPLGAALRRPFEMNRFSFAAMAAVLVVLLGGGALILSRATAPDVGGPSPTAAASAASPAPSSLAGPLPAAIQGTWLGSNRTVPGLSAVGGTALHIGATSMALTGASAEQRNLISVSASGNGAALVISTAAKPTDGCQAGQSGTYAYTLSASGQTLTITAGQDACPQREQLFAGTWWLSDCHTQDAEPCLGQLDAGSYGSEYFASVVDQATGWEARYGALTFTLPSGWANDADWPTFFSLAPAADFAGTPLHGNPVEEVGVYSDVHAESQASPCSGQVDRSVGHGAAAYLAWLRTVPGVDVSSTSTVQLDGHQALSVDVTVPAAPTARCDGTDAVIEYLISPSWTSLSAGSTGEQTHAIGAGNRDRLYLIDMPSGYLTAIVVTTSDGSKFDAFVQQAMPIVNSFRFTDAFPNP